MENAKTYYPGELQVGLKDSFELTADAELIDAFTRLSGDVNPLHNDLTFAREAGYKNRVAHGALQQAFISRMAGVRLPGRFCFIKKLTTSYLAPVFEGEKLNIQGELTRMDGGNESGQLKVCISAIAGNEVKSISYVEFGLIGSGIKTARENKAPDSAVNGGNNGPIEKTSHNLLLLGGSGGLGTVVARSLRNNGMECLIAGRNASGDLSVDLAGGEVKKIVTFCESHHISAVIHLASPKPRKAPPSELSIDDLIMSIKVHLSPLREIASAIRGNMLPKLRDIICIGSSWARHHFPEKGFEEYAYAKTLFSFFAADLARDLASRGVRINTIAPSELPLGMHAGIAERTKAFMASKLPSGKMTDPEEVAIMIKELITSEVFITGQEIILAGGKTW